jgi:regulator of protease activity HflC (stomatin/prohibitin superfamily)
MADITRYPFFFHLRADATSHILHYRAGKLRRTGRGLAFWFSPMSASLAEVPVDARELPLLFHGRSSDFQDVSAQGVLTYRVADPAALAQQIDFTIDLGRGTHLKQPLEKMALLLSGLAQQHAWEFIAHTPLRDILRDGQGVIRLRIEQGLNGDEGLARLGVAILSVRISALRPTPDLEKALEAPMRERIQQDSDEAAFQRRALAVEKERAIQENELQNKIELARREEQLIVQEGQNARRKAGEDAEANRIGTEAEVRRAELLDASAANKVRVEGEAQAKAIELVEGARARAEGERMKAYEGVAPAVLLGLAAQGIARKLHRIEHLSITPELLTPLLAQLAQAGGRGTARKE